MNRASPEASVIITVLPADVCVLAHTSRLILHGFARPG
jgi:hypothetical protein